MEALTLRLRENDVWGLMEINNHICQTPVSHFYVFQEIISIYTAIIHSMLGYGVLQTMVR